MTTDEASRDETRARLRNESTAAEQRFVRPAAADDPVDYWRQAGPGRRPYDLCSVCFLTLAQHPAGVPCGTEAPVSHALPAWSAEDSSALLVQQVYERAAGELVDGDVAQAAAYLAVIGSRLSRALIRFGAAVVAAERRRTGLDD